MVWLRWLGVVPAAYVGWPAALILGIMLVNLAEMFCPPSEMISGMCVAWWFHSVEKAIFAFSAALAAFLVIALSVLVAPSHRHIVAWTAFAGGATVATVMGWQASAYAELIAALLVGGITAMYLGRQRVKTDRESALHPGHA